MSSDRGNVLRRMIHGWRRDIPPVPTGVRTFWRPCCLVAAFAAAAGVVSGTLHTSDLDTRAWAPCAEVVRFPPLPIAVPQGPAITVDGVMSEDEWSRSTIHAMSGGQQLLMHHDGSRLYLGVRAGALGWAHVAVLNQDVVLVRHASAALGTFAYRSIGPMWLLDRRTKWAMRDTSQTDSTRAARSRHIEEEGWVASTAWMGTPGEREFALALGSSHTATLQIAVVYATDEVTPRYSRWPACVGDGVVDEALMAGDAPDSLVFDPGTWAELRLLPDSATGMVSTPRREHEH